MCKDLKAHQSKAVFALNTSLFCWLDLPPHKLIAKQTLFHNVGTAVADMDGVVTALGLPLVGGFIP